MHKRKFPVPRTPRRWWTNGSTRNLTLQNQGCTYTPSCLQGCGPYSSPQALQDATKQFSHSQFSQPQSLHSCLIFFSQSNTILKSEKFRYSIWLCQGQSRTHCLTCISCVLCLDHTSGSSLWEYFFPLSFQVYRPRHVHTHHIIHIAQCLHFNGFTYNIRHISTQYPGRSITPIGESPFSHFPLSPMFPFSCLKCPASHIKAKNPPTDISSHPSCELRLGGLLSIIKSTNRSSLQWMQPPTVSTAAT